MKASEFRLGNFILKNGQVLKVNIARLKEIMEDGLNKKEYEPIPLTEEWLLKFGFYHYSGAIYSKNHYYLVLEGFNFMYGQTVLTKIKYVHQLQNLYFALTGEELQVKDENSSLEYFYIPDSKNRFIESKKEVKLIIKQYLKDNDMI